MLQRQDNAKLIVRFATLDDLEFVAQDAYIPVEIVKRKIEWQEVIVAEQDSLMLGYARIEYLWSIVPYLAMINVLPGHRGQGVGGALLGFIEDYLRGKGLEALYSSSQVDEAKPQQWHRHSGFEECGIIAGINPYGVGEVFFRKRLK